MTVLPLIAGSECPRNGDIVHRAFGRVVLPDRGADAAVADLVEGTVALKAGSSIGLSDSPASCQAVELLQRLAAFAENSKWQSAASTTSVPQAPYY